MTLFRIAVLGDNKIRLTFIVFNLSKENVPLCYLHMTDCSHFLPLYASEPSQDLSLGPWRVGRAGVVYGSRGLSKLLLASPGSPWISLSRGQSRAVWLSFNIQQIFVQRLLANRPRDYICNII